MAVLAVIVAGVGFLAVSSFVSCMWLLTAIVANVFTWCECMQDAFDLFVINSTYFLQTRIAFAPAINPCLLQHYVLCDLTMQRCC